MTPSAPARRTAPSTLLANALPPLLAVYLLGLSTWLSTHRILWLDEFFAWGILTDPSLPHALRAWLEGADSGGVLYYILLHTLLALTGPSVLAARLFGAVLLAGGYLLWFRVLRGVFDVRIAFLASGLLLLSAGYINYLAEVRFYSQLIAAVVLAVWLALWQQRRVRSPAVTFVVFFLVHGALVSSHLLGIVYSALVLAAMLVCTHPRRHLAAAVGAVLSWALLLFARRPIHIGGMRVAGMQLVPPRWGELFSVYHAQPMALQKANILLYLLLAVTALLGLRVARGRTLVRDALLRDDTRSLLLRLSLLLAATPLIFFVESRTAPWSLWVARYMLPCILGLSGCTAFMLDDQSRQAWVRHLPRATKNVVFAALLLSLAAVHLYAVHHQALRPAITSEQLQPLQRGLPVVVADEQLFFQLSFYHHAAGPQFYYVHVGLDTAAGQQNDLMRTIERQGYWGGSLRTREEWLASPSDFLLLESPQRDADLIAQLQQKGWTVASLGSLELAGKHAELLLLTSPKP